MAIKKRPARIETTATRWAGFEGFNGRLIETDTIDCSGDKLEKLVNKAIENDADEVSLRIAQYTPELDPGTFQAIVKFSDRTREWTCCVHADPFQALAHALKQAAKATGKTLKERVGNVSASKDAAGSLRGNPKRRIKLRPRKTGKRT